MRSRGTKPGLALAAGLALASCMATPLPRFSAADTDDIGRVAGWLNAHPRFTAHFSQTGDFGPGTGLLWVDRPGHLRLDYAGAGGRVMVVSGGRVRALDRGTGATSTMPISRTPLGILLDQTVTLSGAVTVAAVQHVQDDLRITLQKTDAPTLGSLTLEFADHPLRLAAVTVTDAHQRSLSLSLSGFDAAPVITPDLFVPPALAAPKS